MVDEIKVKVCYECGKEFVSYSEKKQLCTYCSTVMREANNLALKVYDAKCLYCGKTFLATYKHGICEQCKKSEDYNNSRVVPNMF